MSKLCKRIVLIHELRKLRRSEKFLYCCNNGADIDKRLRRDNIKLLNTHALAHTALHARNTDAELILQKLTHAAQTAVAQMVNIVVVPDSVGKVVAVVN